jgi:homogentisate phytyltransferase/homogentisate geranylgeranyltransferase
MKSISALWQFSRPHTVIGSMISIVTLYIIICNADLGAHLLLLLFALVIGISCNIFIVGLNQVADVELDRINKPYLPIPAGKMSIRRAKIITYSAALLSLTLALSISIYLFGIILLASAIGWAYSMPPFLLKKHHMTAALAISLVRGILINAGGFMVFNYIVNHSIQLPDDVKILTAFIMIFSIVISWFKDIPDRKGDSVFNIRSLVIISSPRITFFAGNILLVLTYLFTISLKFSDADNYFASLKSLALFYGHILLLALFIINSLFVNLESHRSVKKFYMRFWWFFFAEYVLYLTAYIADGVMRNL